MSLERDLLGRWHNGDLLPEEYMQLMKETKELLAQPEQEQEPVAWKVIDGTNEEYMFSRVKPMERAYKYDVVIPLYTTPPKREPLSYEHLEALADEYEGCPMTLGRAVEMAHGIGGGE